MLLPSDMFVRRCALIGEAKDEEGIILLLVVKDNVDVWIGDRKCVAFALLLLLALALVEEDEGGKGGGGGGGGG